MINLDKAISQVKPKMILSRWKTPAKSTNRSVCLKPTAARKKADNIPITETSVKLAHFWLLNSLNLFLILKQAIGKQTKTKMEKKS